MSHDHHVKIIVDFNSAIIIAENKINELAVLLELDDNKKIFYEAGIKIGKIVKQIYNAFNTQNFDLLPKLKYKYNEEMIITLNILEHLVEKNIFNEDAYIQYANAFKKRKEEYDILCNNPANVKGIPLCPCCIPKKKFIVLR